MSGLVMSRAAIAMSQMCVMMVFGKNRVAAPRVIPSVSLEASDDRSDGWLMKNVS